MTRPRTATTRTPQLAAIAALCSLLAAAPACKSRSSDKPETRPAETQPPVRAELLADVQSTAPGRSFTLGVMLHVRPGWHVYWKYPGDAGLPTQVDLKLPDGFTAGAVRYPAPMRFAQPGDVVEFGYKRAVLLMAGVKAPNALPSTGPVTLSADVSWLACKERCVPGSAKLKLVMPVAKNPSPSNRALFARWRQSLPVDAAAAPFKATVNGGIRPPRRRGDFTITLEGAFVPRTLEWIYAGVDTIAIKRAQVNTTRGRGRITFTAEVLPGMETPTEPLETLLVYPDPGGLRRAVHLYVPLSPAKAADTTTNPHTR